MEEEDNVAELKRKLEQAVGIPAADMKIRLGGYNQFVMIDTTSNIRVGSCGLTQGAQGPGAGRRNTNRHGTHPLPLSLPAVHLAQPDAARFPESFK